MRARLVRCSMLLTATATAIATVGALWVGADAAHALAFGPVSVPVTVPPVTVPPVTVPPAVATPPTLPPVGVSVDVAPLPPVAINVSLPPVTVPSSLLPPPLRIGVSVGSAGVHVGVPTAPRAVPGSDAASASPARSGVDRSHLAGTAPSATGAAVPPLFPPVVPARATTANAYVLPPNAVSAALRHPAPGGTWSLLRELASTLGLWLALAMILFAARCVAGGMLRDAYRRVRAVSSS